MRQLFTIIFFQLVYIQNLFADSKVSDLPPKEMNSFNIFLQKWMPYFGVEDIVPQYGIFFLFVTFSIFLIYRLWKNNKSDFWIKKVFWSIVIFVPIFGWIFYGGLYKSPPVKPENMQSKGVKGVLGFWGGGPRH